MRPASPLRQIMDIRPDEWPQTLLMSGYFFLVIVTFWILKPLKKGLFVQFYDQSALELAGWQLHAAQAELIAKVGNMGVAFFAAATFVYLSRFLEREQLTYVFGGLSILAMALFAGSMADPGPLTVWSFYFFGDLFSTVMVATFFAFLNHSVAPDSAKRMYGLVGLGGVAGGAFGSIVLAGSMERLSLPGWLWVSAVLTTGVIALAAMAGRRFAPIEHDAPNRSERDIGPPNGSGLSGGRLVFGSRYLLSIVVIVGLYEMVSTLMDFQFTSTIAHYMDGDAIGIQFARVFALTNSSALLVQLFLTSFVMTRFGVGAALLVLPAAALAASVGFMAAPVLLTGSFLNTADNAFSYSINQSAKEVLYTPTSKAAKYQAKAFIDMFMQRFAKAMAVALSLWITTAFTGLDSIRWLSLVTVAILAVWIPVARFAGHEFRRLTSADIEAGVLASIETETFQPDRPRGVPVSAGVKP